jgi:hypothetical protein
MPSPQPGALLGQKRKMSCVGWMCETVLFWPREEVPEYRRSYEGAKIFYNQFKNKTKN